MECDDQPHQLCLPATPASCVLVFGGEGTSYLEKHVIPCFILAQPVWTRAEQKAEDAATKGSTGRDDWRCLVQLLKRPIRPRGLTPSPGLAAVGSLKVASAGSKGRGCEDSEEMVPQARQVQERGRNSHL